MDPQATWDGLLAALAEKDWDMIEDSASGLADWLARGGFSPVVVGLPGTDLDFERALAKAGCRYALGLVRARRQTSDILPGFGTEET